MRSFVVFGLAATAFAAPVRRALTSGLANLPVVSNVVGLAGSVAGPAEGTVVNPLTGTLGSLPVAGPLVGGVVDTAVGALSNVRRRSLTGGLTALPGVSTVVDTVGGVAGPVEGAVVNPVVSLAGGLPVVGGPAGTVVNTVIGTLSNVRRSITGPLTGIPGVNGVVGTVGSVAGPVEGAVVNPVVQTLKGLPVIGGPAGGVVDTVISTLSNVRREPEPQDLTGSLDTVTSLTDAVPLVGGTVSGLVKTPEGVTTGPLSTINGLGGGVLLREAA